MDSKPAAPRHDDPRVLRRGAGGAVDEPAVRPPARGAYGSSVAERDRCSREYPDAQGSNGETRLAHSGRACHRCARDAAGTLGRGVAVPALGARSRPRLSPSPSAAGRRVALRLDRPGARASPGAGRGRRGDLGDGARREGRRRPHVAQSRRRRVSAVRRRARWVVRRVGEDPLRDGTEETLSRRIELPD